MGVKIRAMVRPALLIWARNVCGLTVEQAAKKIAVNPLKLKACEDGSEHLTFKQLVKAANVYKLPISAFYLPSAPKLTKALKDFRSLPGILPPQAEYWLNLAVREARNQRDVAIELYEEIGEIPDDFDVRTSLKTDPEIAASKLRTSVGFSMEEQLNTKDVREAYNAWRSALESKGLLVFQARRVPVEAMRGFSMNLHPMPVVVVNSSDTLTARTFTALHELVHIALRKSGLCNLDDEANCPPECRQVEVFCNRVAGAILLPKADLLAHCKDLGRTSTSSWSVERIEDSAKLFRLGRETFARRLNICGVVSRSHYQKYRAWLQSNIKPRSKSKGGPSPDKIVLSKLGKKYTGLVLESFYRGRITTLDVTSYLGIRVKHLGKIEMSLSGHTVAFGE